MSDNLLASLEALQRFYNDPCLLTEVIEIYGDDYVEDIEKAATEELETIKGELNPGLYRIAKEVIAGEGMISPMLRKEILRIEKETTEFLAARALMGNLRQQVKDAMADWEQSKSAEKSRQIKHLFGEIMARAQTAEAAGVLTDKDVAELKELMGLEIRGG